MTSYNPLTGDFSAFLADFYPDEQGRPVVRATTRAEENAQRHKWDVIMRDFWLSRHANTWWCEDFSRVPPVSLVLVTIREDDRFPRVVFAEVGIEYPHKVRPVVQGGGGYELLAWANVPLPYDPTGADFRAKGYAGRIELTPQGGPKTFEETKQASAGGQQK